MENIQTRVLDAIEKAITSGGLIPTKQAEYGNTGVVYAQTEDFTTRLYVRYNFQSGYAVFTVGGQAVVEVYEGVGLEDSPPAFRLEVDPHGGGPVRDVQRKYHSLSYTDGERVREFIQAIADHAAQPFDGRTINEGTPGRVTSSVDDDGAPTMTMTLPTYEGELSITVSTCRSADGDWVVSLPWPAGVDEDRTEPFKVVVDHEVELEAAPNGVLYIGAPDMERPAEWTHENGITHGD